eukprot:6744655-Prymnesium_polylepis.1
MLVTGAFGDFLLEGSAHPWLLFAGVACSISAVVTDSRSHPSPAQDDLTKLASADAAAVTTTTTVTAAVPEPSLASAPMDTM